jgi:hypothetical protein
LLKKTKNCLEFREKQISCSARNDSSQSFSTIPRAGAQGGGQFDPKWRELIVIDLGEVDDRPMRKIPLTT